MVKSMFAGVSGLRTHQTKMDVIGNNIANVNTYGFKSSRTTFKDSFYQTLTGSSAPGGAFGGGNATQIGYGTQVASVDVLHTPGGFVPTDNASDIMINGNGFFMVGPQYPGGVDPENGDAAIFQLTRIGNFRFDGDGNLVDPNRNYVYGFQGYSIGENTADIAAAHEANGGTLPLVLSSPDGDQYRIMDLAGTLEPVAPATAQDLANIAEPPIAGFTLTTALTDAGGTAYPAGDNTIDIAATITAAGGAFPAVLADGSGNQFNLAADGTLTAVDPTVDVASVATAPTTGYTFKYAVSDNSMLIPISFPKDPVTGEAVKLSNITFGADGTITGVDDSDNLINIGKVAIANVPNSSALEQTQSSYYTAKQNTGLVTAHVPGAGTTGTIESSVLEASNVDLSREFTEMITTQRGYQANTRIITVSDEMLEELVNIKR